MGFLKKHLGGHVAPLTGGFSLLFKKGRKLYRHASRDLRKRLGITSKSKFVRQFKRRLGFDKNAFASPPTSASTVGYQHQPRTLSQLTGGV